MLAQPFKEFLSAVALEVGRVGDFLRGRLEAEAQEYCTALLQLWRKYNAVLMAVIGMILDPLGIFLVLYLPDLPKEFSLALPYVVGSLACHASWYFVLQHGQSRHQFHVFTLNVVLISIGFARVGHAIMAIPNVSPALVQVTLLLQGALSNGVMIFYPSYRPIANVVVTIFLFGVTCWMWRGQSDIARPLVFSAGISVALLLFKMQVWSRLIRDAYRQYLEKKRLRDAERALLQKELELARRIQDSFRPASFLRWGERDIHCLTQKHNEVGGDWAAMHVDGSGALTMVVVDAAGKGFQAALVVHAVQSLWAEHLSDVKGFDVSQWLERVNHSLVVMGRNEVHMVTMGIVRLEGDRGSYWSAGHLPMSLIHDDVESRVQSISAVGNPLGIFEGMEWRPTEFRFNATSCLMLGSDGVFHKGTRHKHMEIVQIYREAKAGEHAALAAMPAQDDKTLILVDRILLAPAGSSQRAEQVRRIG